MRKGKSQEEDGGPPEVNRSKNGIREKQSANRERSPEKKGALTRELVLWQRTVRREVMLVVATEGNEIDLALAE